MFLSKRAAKLTPYTAGEQPQDKQYIKLNTNENPYPPSPQVEKAIRSFDLNNLRLYPDPESTALRQAIAAVEGTSAARVFCGNGSDEVLAFAFAAFFDHRGVWFPEITYSFYPVYAGLFQIPYRKIGLAKDYSIRPELYFPGKKPAGGIVIANPNAPTSIGLPLAGVETIVKANPQCVVIIDEAYMDFFGQSAVPLTEKYPNLLVIKTFSKSYSLAGMRIGYAIGDTGLLSGLWRVKDSFNSYPLDMLAQAAGAAAISDRDYHRQACQTIISVRDSAAETLREMGCTVLPSDANFLFAAHPAVSGSDLYLRLKERGILVRHFDRNRVRDFVRVTVGTEQQMQLFLQAVRQIIA